MNETDEILLRRIANHQMLHGSFCGDPGILNGKMGVVIFFSIMPAIQGMRCMKTLPEKCWMKCLKISMTKYLSVFLMVYPV